MMAFPDDQVAWLLSNRPTVLRHIHGLQVIVGLVVMALGFHMGHVHFHLIRAGVRTQGRIIGYHQEQFQGAARLSARPVTCPLCGLTAFVERSSVFPNITTT
jgi:hypothetical protein